MNWSLASVTSWIYRWTDSEALKLYTSMLLEEAGEDDSRDALRTLLKIMRNIQQNPTEDKYRTIRKENKSFHSKVWRWESAEQFLYAVGWIDVDDSIVLTEVGNIPTAISVLEEILTKCSVITHSVNQDTPVIQMSERDKMLKENQRKLMERLKKEKEEKEKIKEQIKADRKNVSTREIKDSRARNMKFGANIRKFEDIGVDLNKGGG